ncbi:MAG: pyridoxal phosphate-dependent aminotransferase [Planctomycetota bacterium]|jgi:aspartate/methionine/tyrosine aminotransferase
MRNKLLKSQNVPLKYAIRDIVTLANSVQEKGVEISWENIGDPIQKGEIVESWIKDIITVKASENISYGYCPTAGVLEAREFIAAEVNSRNGAQISVDDIIFFNGLGDGIAKIYRMLDPAARVIGPSPAYSPHSTAEGSHSDSAHITYRCDPENKWLPDIDDLKRKIGTDSGITGILLINPGNPTGAVLPEDMLKDIVEIARQNKMFIICDEIYSKIVYNGHQPQYLSELIGDVPGIAMRGISKEVPWPGSRCGWIEIYNRDKDPEFDEYAQKILALKMVEVCSTTLPQMCIPEIIGDSRYPELLKRRAAMFEARANEATDFLAGIEGVRANCPDGAFYYTVAFADGLLTDRQTLQIDSSDIRALVENSCSNIAFDQRFVHYLLGASGICVVPLSGFSCETNGFRFILLECDDKKRSWIFKTIADSIKEYISS